MHLENVDFLWRESESEQPCHAVLVRLIGLTDHAHDDGDVSGYLMHRAEDGSWRLRLRLPSTLRTTYHFCPIRDAPWAGHPTDERWAQILSAGVPDPLNPLSLPAGTTYGNSCAASILELPDALPQPWALPRPGVAKGDISRHELGQGSIVHLYTPPGYEPGLPLVILFDGGWWMKLEVATTFDNLIADGATPPMADGLVAALGGGSSSALESEHLQRARLGGRREGEVELKQVSGG